MVQLPLCFILMPIGEKKDPGTGKTFNFDRIYEQSIRPAVVAAEMEPIRADEARTGGVFHRLMFERFMLCDYAIADLTTANANLFYELGVRHAVRPATTLTIFASGQPLPYDVNFLRALPYFLASNQAFADDEAAQLKSKLTHQLRELKRLQRQNAAPDSSVSQLPQDCRRSDIVNVRRDVFRQLADYSVSTKNALAAARDRLDNEAVRAIEQSQGAIADAEAGVVIDLFLSYRAVSNWQAMVDLFERMSVPLKRSILMREQLGFAYNRLNMHDKATSVLEEVLNEQGPSSETCGLLGHVQKDRWVEAVKAGKPMTGRGHLDCAIDLYRTAFETDPRDAGPGVNVVTLLDIRGDDESIAEKNKLVPVVWYAVQRRLKAARSDYSDYAAMLELVILANEPGKAVEFLARALTEVREPWEAETTANNLGLIRDARAARGIDVGWLDEIITALRNARGPNFG